MIEKPKLCVDCRWYDPERKTFTDRTGCCSHPELVDRVDGASVVAFYARTEGARCGWDGKLWEAPPSAEPERKGDKQ